MVISQLSNKISNSVVLVLRVQSTRPETSLLLIKRRKDTYLQLLAIDITYQLNKTPGDEETSSRTAFHFDLKGKSVTSSYEFSNTKQKIFRIRLLMGKSQTFHLLRAESRNTSQI